MRILICDDNEAIVRQLQGYIREFFGTLGGKLPELGVYDSGEALLARETRADMAFLDVEMPGVSGIHIGAKLKERNPYIKIFIVTAYPDYLDEAMHFQVFRYLSKPIDKNRLFRNLKDAISQFGICIPSRERSLRWRKASVISSIPTGRTTRIKSSMRTVAQPSTERQSPTPPWRIGWPACQSWLWQRSGRRPTASRRS